MPWTRSWVGLEGFLSCGFCQMSMWCPCNVHSAHAVWTQCKNIAMVFPQFPQFFISSGHGLVTRACVMCKLIHFPPPNQKLLQDNVSIGTQNCTLMLRVGGLEFDLM